MTPALQNRLVGTIILVALAVIFLPDILDGKKQTNQDIFVELPKRPETKPVRKVQPFPEEDVARLTTQPIEQIIDPILDDPEPEQVIPDISEVQNSDSSIQPNDNIGNSEQQPISAGWVVQLGVFRHQKNVRELLDKLQKAGYRAFSRKINTSSGELTKVFVGPDLHKKKLQDALGHLQEVTKLQGRITPFTVN